MTYDLSQIRDPILNVFFQKLTAKAGDNFGGAVLFGSRARANYRRDDAYDIAVFFKEIADKSEAFDRLSVLSQELLEIFGAEFHIFPFNTAEYETRSGLMNAIRKGGIAFMLDPKGMSTAPVINAQVEEILSRRDVFCIDIEASALGEQSYPIEIGLANVKSGEVRSWLVRPTELWLNEYIWAADSALIHNIPRQMLIDEGVPSEQVIEEMKEFLGRRPKLLSDDEDCDKSWLTTLKGEIDFPMSPFFVDDFQELAWDLTCAAGRAQDVAFLYQLEHEAQSRFSQQHRAGPDARRNAEILRIIAGYS